MAIGFARAEMISRSRGRSSLERLDYIARTTMNADDLLFPIETVLPRGARAEFSVAAALWTAVEAATRRADAILGVELLLSLPTPDEISNELARAMTLSFIASRIVRPHGLAATVGLHAASGATDHFRTETGFWSGDNDDFDEEMKNALLNRHAHVLITPRGALAGGLARKRNTALDPEVRGEDVVDAIHWGKVWGIFQNQFLAAHGAQTRVRLPAPQSFRPALLGQVRRDRAWRKTQGLSGRGIVVDEEAERANTAALAGSDEILASIEAPVTEIEIGDLLRRYHRNLQADYLLQKTLGSDQLIRLTDATTGTPSGWLTTQAAVRAEMRAIGRIAALAVRHREPPPIDARVGYSRQMRDLAHAVFGGQSLAMIETGRHPEALLNDLSSIALAADLVPVSVAHRAGSIHPKRTTIVELDTLVRRPVSKALIMVDRADALCPAELDLLSQAALAGGSRLVLVRRRADPFWPSADLMRLVRSFLTVQSWPPAKRKTATALGASRTDRIVNFRDDAAGVTRLAIKLAAAAAATATPVTILVAGAERAAALRADLEASAIDALVTDVLPAIVAGRLIVIHFPDTAQGQLIAPQLARAPNMTILVDRSQTPDVRALAEQMRLGSQISLALAYTPDGAPGPVAGSPRSALARFAVSQSGSLLTDPADVVSAIVDAAEAPFDIEWSRDDRLVLSKRERSELARIMMSGASAVLDPVSGVEPAFDRDDDLAVGGPSSSLQNGVDIEARDPRGHPQAATIEEQWDFEDQLEVGPWDKPEGPG